jgi:hypothetical protein
MINIFNAQEGQSIADLVLNTYGSLNLSKKFISDNGLTDLNVLARTGDQYVYDTEFIDNETLFATVMDNKLIFRTGIYEMPPVYVACEDSTILQTEDDKLFLK